MKLKLERNLYIQRLVKKGWSQAAVGWSCGITRQRANQIVHTDYKQGLLKKIIYFLRGY